ncbi:MAG: hypothetical protein CL811_08445 [Colwelliaceae bacterium]|nr:hypothetical protein [Colwelliaceae bacterium]|tara:strand:+ start:944 stop:1201 length:258 start_codon:yes stop_codon:yes gene_type:complete
MQAVEKGQNQTERRIGSPTYESLCHQLSMSQRYSVNALNQYGYQLRYLRRGEQGNLAIMLCEESVASVNEQGEIETSPAINLRQS